jgi:putative membrane protein
MDIANSLQGFGPFLAYFGAALVAEAVFVGLYVAVTPHHEFRLIREGNTAAAVSLGGAVLGFTLPLASAMANSVSVADMAIWAAIALVAQIVVFVATNLALSGLSRKIDEGNMAAGTTLAVASLVIGMLNAASLTY